MFWADFRVVANIDKDCGRKIKNGKGKKKKGQATFIAPLRPNTLAVFPPWGIQRELVVKDLPGTKVEKFSGFP